MEEKKNTNEEKEIVESQAKKNDKTYHKGCIKIFITLAIILIIISILSTGFAIANIINKEIITGVTIDGFSVEGLNKEEAKRLLQRKINDEINIYVDENLKTISLSQIEVEYDIDSAVEEAFQVGRAKNIFINNFDTLKVRKTGKNIEINSTYNEELLDNTVRKIKEEIPKAVIQPSYSIEGENLIITTGKKGFTIDEKELKDKIIQAIDLKVMENIKIKSFEIEPEKIEIEAIYNEVYREPKDAYYTKNPFVVHPEQDGIDFSIEEAKKILKDDKDNYIIKLIITHAKKTTKEIGTEDFPDLLATFSTKYSSKNKPRTTNLQVATNKINGVIVMPGEIFSYNETLGKRTYERGYREAAGYSGGKVVQTIGGGICQISSTLYNTVVYANLDIVERHNHAFTTGYVGAGKDATVVYGGMDFKFKNSRKNPIKIVSSLQNGVATVSIYGMKEEVEYDVEISTTILGYISYNTIYEDDSSLDYGAEKVTQKGQKGCKSITYKILKLEGKEISKTILSKDTYKAMNKYISRGIKGQEMNNAEEQETVMIQGF